MAKQPRVVPAFDPAKYDPDGYTTRCLQALRDGKANDVQQKHALEWIINEASRTYDQPYRPGVDGERETAFACGRMFVGQQIIKVMKLSMPQKDKA